ncbi:hypothetical protein [Thermanaeromonas toyohensis]|nr:hypothetical protein [Thermanaeromonas toyohensis]
MNLNLNLAELSLDELKALSAAVAEEIKRRLRVGEGIEIVLETDGWYDPRKNGGAYVAIVRDRPGGGVEREFVDPVQKVYDSKRRKYRAKWVFRALPGTRIEARIRSGSWRNEHRDYYVVGPDGLREASQGEVLGL